jgi:hypothetical protein
VELTPEYPTPNPVPPPDDSSPAGPRSLKGALAGVLESTLPVEQVPCRRADLCCVWIFAAVSRTSMFNAGSVFALRERFSGVHP